MNQELLKKARAAKSPEELLKLAHENGREEFGEESAKAYFDVLQKTGEITEEELENASGGGCNMFGAFDRMMTTILNSCRYYRCHWCNTKG